MLIDGAWIETSGTRLDVVNPARPKEVVGTIGAATADDVDRAAQAAHRAFGLWRATPLEDRLELFAKAAAIAVDLPGDIPTLLTREMGKVAWEARMDIAFAELAFVNAAEVGPAALEPINLSDEFGSVSLERVPRGVAALILPWNWPVAIGFLKLAPALLSGNTVVWLPSPFASLAVGRTLEAIADVFPPGVINFITGLGHEAGAALVSHPLVRTVSFTGGVETGREVLRTLAPTLKTPILELGGNDPAIVLDDAEVNDDLAQSLLLGAFMTSGQNCLSIKRLYVARGLYDDVVEACTAAAADIIVGDGLAEETTMGPLANQRQLTRFTGFVDEARSRGATVIETGALNADPDDGGYFHRPVLVTGVDETFSVVACEQFGPALPILPYDSIDEAVTRANSTEFGLMSSVWSSDPERAWGVARRIESGTTWVNQHSVMAVDLRAPVGGMKQSGIGYELGPHSFEQFTAIHQLNDRHLM
jgi:aldehyde dehydrogenase